MFLQRALWGPLLPFSSERRFSQWQRCQPQKHSERKIYCTCNYISISLYRKAVCYWRKYFLVAKPVIPAHSEWLLGFLCQQQHHKKNVQREQITLPGHSSATPDGSGTAGLCPWLPQQMSLWHFKPATETCSVVFACWGLKKSIHLMIPFQGMPSNTSHRQAPARNRAFKCPETSGMMGKEWSSNKRGSFEARRPPDISGKWCGTAITAGDFGSPGQQDRLAVVCTKVLCGTPAWAGCGASSLLCAVSPLGQDCRLKLPSPAQD